MDVKGLDEKLSELKKELIKLNAQIAVGTTIKNPGQVKKIKKTIARVHIIKSQKETETKDTPKEAKKEKKEPKQKEVEKKQ